MTDPQYLLSPLMLGIFNFFPPLSSFNHPPYPILTIQEVNSLVSCERNAVCAKVDIKR